MTDHAHIAHQQKPQTAIQCPLLLGDPSQPPLLKSESLIIFKCLPIDGWLDNCHFACGYPCLTAINPDVAILNLRNLPSRLKLIDAI